MEMHTAPAAAAAKRMWRYLRAVLFMVRRGKRKLFVGVHLLMKRRNKALARTVANLLSHHHHHGGSYHGGGNALRRRDYEFSCSNSPDPGSFSFSFSSGSSSRRRLAYFPCLGAVAEEYDDAAAAPAPSPLARIEYYAYASPVPASSSSPPGILTPEFAPGEGEDLLSLCASPAAPAGAFSVRVSNYSSEDDEGGAGGGAVDDDAEEFIRRFYEQLRRQNHVALLPYHLQEPAAA